MVAMSGVSAVHVNVLGTVDTLTGAVAPTPWDGAWFAEDYCEGPGQALIVNPRGEVKPCCRR